MGSDTRPTGVGIFARRNNARLLDHKNGKISLVRRLLFKPNSPTRKGEDPLNLSCTLLKNSWCGLFIYVSLVETLAEALESIRRAADPPSEELLISLAWARLSRRNPDIESARHALDTVVKETARSVKPPTDIISARQVRETYQLLTQREPADAISYLQAVISARQGDRHDTVDTHPEDRAVRSIGTELAARLCIVSAHVIPQSL